jgi:phosphoesterase RecJ-like protein
MIPEIMALIAKHDKFFITSHIRPDGDAIGSVAALGGLLKKLGKKVEMMLSDPAPNNLTWLAKENGVQTFEGSIEDRNKIVLADVIFVVDVNQLDRLGELAKSVEQSPAKKILVDHHLDPQDWFDLRYVENTATSTGELVYNIIQAHDLSLMDEFMARALYTAIMTDTGSFRFDTVTAKTHHIIAEIMERGNIAPADIHIKVYDNKSLGGLQLLGMSLETLHLVYDGRLSYMVVNQDMIRRSGAHTSEAEGFVNHLLSIDSVQICVLFLEIERGIKMSFRSKGEIAVNKWASHFGGGGHRNASGAFVQGKLNNIIKKVIETAPLTIL